MKSVGVKPLVLSSLPGRLTVAVAVHCPSAEAGSVRLTVAGVASVGAPAVPSVPLVLSVQSTVQFTRTFSVALAVSSVTLTVIADGEGIVPVTTQLQAVGVLVELPSQRSAKFAWATPMLALTAPAASSPVTAP